MTGEPDTQTWYEQAHITCRSPQAEAARKASHDEYYGRIRDESAKRKTVAQKTPITDVQLKYLTRLIEQLGIERFDAEYAKAIKGTTIKPRAPGSGQPPPRSG
ncbi:hypothetical protein [Streptomyces chartreusis]|uniref:hypothetical protein n=1 Tax=Streptomyces chartreusis TaxID=1969 RepID=UPI0036C42BB5